MGIGRNIAIVIVAVITIAVMVGCAGDDPESSSSPAQDTVRFSTPTPTASVGLRVAVIDGNGFSEDDIDAIRANVLLRDIAARCAGTPSTDLIADFAVFAEQFLREDRGVDLDVLEILEGVNLMTLGQSGLACAETFTAYITRRGI